MKLVLYNTLTRKKEKFIPLKKGAVSMYHCGPTVYGAVHIGNLRSFVFADTLRRAAASLGFKVTQVMNITDVDDKTIRKAGAEGVALKEITTRYENDFLRDIAALNILRPQIMPRATEHIQEMITLIERLLKKEIAYRGDDGSVYFNIARAKNYGHLAGIRTLSATAGAHTTRDEYGKDEAHDFVLWKAWKKEDGNAHWEAPFGKGRPGWHIECSAMSTKYLGEQFDIHTGGIDLIFPHHTNEIAQSKSATGKLLARYWLHNNFLTVNGEKISKSLKNDIYLKDIIARGIHPLSYRYVLLTAHYRTPVNFTWEALAGAEHARARLYEYYAELPRGAGKKIKTYAEKFEKHIENDLDTPGAIAVLWNMLKDKKSRPQDIKATLLYFDAFLGLGLRGVKKEKIPDEVRTLVALRERARKEKNWKQADETRKKIETLGFLVKDTSAGSVVQKK